MATRELTRSQSAASDESDGSVDLWKGFAQRATDPDYEQRQKDGPFVYIKRAFEPGRHYYEKEEQRRLAAAAQAENEARSHADNVVEHGSRDKERVRSSHAKQVTSSEGACKRATAADDASTRAVPPEEAQPASRANRRGAAAPAAEAEAVSDGGSQRDTTQRWRSSNAAAGQATSDAPEADIRRSTVRASRSSQRRDDGGVPRSSEVSGADAQMDSTLSSWLDPTPGTAAASAKAAAGERRAADVQGPSRGQRPSRKQRGEEAAVPQPVAGLGVPAEGKRSAAESGAGNSRRRRPKEAAHTVPLVEGTDGAADAAAPAAEPHGRRRRRPSQQSAQDDVAPVEKDVAAAAVTGASRAALEGKQREGPKRMEVPGDAQGTLPPPPPRKLRSTAQMAERESSRQEVATADLQAAQPLASRRTTVERASERRRSSTSSRAPAPPPVEGPPTAVADGATEPLSAPLTTEAPANTAASSQRRSSTDDLPAAVAAVAAAVAAVAAAVTGDAHPAGEPVPHAAHDNVAAALTGAVTANEQPSAQGISAAGVTAAKAEAPAERAVTTQISPVSDTAVVPALAASGTPLHGDPAAPATQHAAQGDEQTSIPQAQQQQPETSAQPAVSPPAVTANGGSSAAPAATAVTVAAPVASAGQANLAGPNAEAATNGSSSNAAAAGTAVQLPAEKPGGSAADVSPVRQQLSAAAAGAAALPPAGASQVTNDAQASAPGQAPASAAATGALPPAPPMPYSQAVPVPPAPPAAAGVAAPQNDNYAQSWQGFGSPVMPNHPAPYPAAPGYHYAAPAQANWPAAQPGSHYAQSVYGPPSPQRAPYQTPAPPAYSPHPYVSHAAAAAAPMPYGPGQASYMPPPPSYGAMSPPPPQRLQPYPAPDGYGSYHQAALPPPYVTQNGPHAAAASPAAPYAPSTYMGPAMGPAAVSPRLWGAEAQAPPAQAAWSPWHAQPWAGYQPTQPSWQQQQQQQQQQQHALEMQYRQLAGYYPHQTPQAIVSIGGSPWQQHPAQMVGFGLPQEPFLAVPSFATPQ